MPKQVGLDGAGGTYPVAGKTQLDEFTTAGSGLQPGGWTWTLPPGPFSMPAGPLAPLDASPWCGRRNRLGLSP